MNAETFERLLKQAVPDGKAIREIRIRAGKPVMIWTETGGKRPFFGWKLWPDGKLRGRRTEIV